MTNREKADAIIAGLANDLRPAVEKIEKAIPVTRNHYGAYLDFFTICTDSTNRKIVAYALLKAGANKEGVLDALRIC